MGIRIENLTFNQKMLLQEGDHSPLRHLAHSDYDRRYTQNENKDSEQDKSAEKKRKKKKKKSKRKEPEHESESEYGENRDQWK